LKPAQTRRQKAREGLSSGIRKGLSGFYWMMKILVPISLLTTLLIWSGWLDRIQHLVQPVMGWLSLPAMAALPLLVGVFAGIYGAIAAMASLPLSPGHMTLIALFLLTAHNLIQESAIQSQSGLNAIKAIVYRLLAASLITVTAAYFLGITPGDSQAAARLLIATKQPLNTVLLSWLVDTIRLSAKMFVVIVGLLIVMELIKAMDWLNPIIRLCAPLLKALGLSEKAGVIWIAAALFGLSYAAAIIVEEAKSGLLEPAELEQLQVSIGINHSLIEDPILFLALGLNAFWLWVPRMLVAILAVRAIQIWQRISTRHRTTPII
jgi:hypothetical protein